MDEVIFALFSMTITLSFPTNIPNALVIIFIISIIISIISIIMN